MRKRSFKVNGGHARTLGYSILAAAVLAASAFLLSDRMARRDFAQSSDGPFAREVKAGVMDADIVVLQYFDLECPSCREHDRAGEPHLMRRYAGAPVAFAYRHLPLSYLHPGARIKAEVLECAAAQRPSLYAQARSALYRQEGAATSSLIGAVSLPLNLDAEAMRSCVERGEERSIVESGIRSATLQGVYMTPTFIIYADGKARARIDGYRIGQLERTLDALLAERAHLP